MKIIFDANSKEIVELISKIQAQLQRNGLDKVIEKITRSLQSQKSSSPRAEWRTQPKNPETP